jgi:predicted Rossmann fold nucleotide-binding protein DprA/Smf involved in DNA uptake
VIFGAGARRAQAFEREKLTPVLRSLLRELALGRDIATALKRAGVGAEQGIAALAALELAGYVLREPGGRFSVTA